ncbi:MAG: M43 family zinc metalloprotease [Bacteroidia bacterium]
MVISSQGKSLALAIILLLFSNFVIAQDRLCTTDLIHQHKLISEPGYRERFLEAFSVKTGGRFTTQSADTTITIPVVVHVIGYQGVFPVSEVQIQSQIDVLNEDYALLNSTSLNIPSVWLPLAKDSKIRFQMAQQDPSGNPSNGVTWSMGTKYEYDIFDPAIYETDSGGYDAWPRSSYLNIWVCRLSGNALGYANYPGSAPANDGVVISPRAFGRLGTSGSPYDLGRTATHEVGHWLSLIHIWGDDPSSSPCSGKDFTGAQLTWDDTPNQAQPTYRCKTFPALDDCASAAPGYMYMNYMDYTDDKCMMFFTAGQIRKCRTILDGLRDSLKISNGCVLPLFYNHDIGIDSVLSPVRVANDRCLSPVIRIRNYGTDTVYSFTISYGLNQQLKKTYAWEGALASGTSVEISLPSIGVNIGHQVMEFRVQDTDDRSINNFRSAGFTTDGNTTSNCSASSFLVYPNPLTGSGFACVKTMQKESQLATVNLFNNLGQLLSTKTMTINPGDAFSVDLTNYPSGCYYVNVTGDVYSESVKLMYLPGDDPAASEIICN